MPKHKELLANTQIIISVLSGNLTKSVFSSKNAFQTPEEEMRTNYNEQCAATFFLS